MPDKPFDIAAGLGGLAMGGASDILGIMTGGLAQKQQLQGQKKALEQQNAAAYDMWLKTNYSAQKEQIKKAGLNPALLYGMSGGGGATIGNANAMPEQTFKSKGMDIMGAAQLRLMDAQARALNAKASLDETDAKKHAGPDTANVESQTELNKANTLLSETNNRIAKLQEEMTSQSMEWLINQTKLTSLKMEEDLEQAVRQNEIGAATKTTQIQIKKQELANMITERALNIAKIGNTQEDTKLKARQILRLIQERSEKLDDQANTMKTLAQKDTELGYELERIINKPLDEAMDIVEKIIQALSLGGVLKYTPARPPIGFGTK